MKNIGSEAIEFLQKKNGRSQFVHWICVSELILGNLPLIFVKVQSIMFEQNPDIDFQVRNEKTEHAEQANSSLSTPLSLYNFLSL